MRESLEPYPNLPSNDRQARVSIPVRALPQQVSYHASQLVEKFLTPQQVSHHDLHGFQWNLISES